MRHSTPANYHLSFAFKKDIHVIALLLWLREIVFFDGVLRIRLALVNPASTSSSCSSAPIAWDSFLIFSRTRCFCLNSACGPWLMIVSRSCTWTVRRRADLATIARIPQFDDRYEVGQGELSVNPRTFPVALSRATLNPGPAPARSCSSTANRKKVATRRRPASAYPTTWIRNAADGAKLQLLTGFNDPDDRRPSSRVTSLFFSRLGRIEEWGEKGGLSDLSNRQESAERE